MTAQESFRTCMHQERLLLYIGVVESTCCGSRTSCSSHSDRRSAPGMRCESSSATFEPVGNTHNSRGIYADRLLLLMQAKSTPAAGELSEHFAKSLFADSPAQAQH